MITVGVIAGVVVLAPAGLTHPMGHAPPPPPPKPVAANVAPPEPAPIPEPWASLAQCESTGRWDYNGSSGYDGGLQFSPRTWSAFKSDYHPDYAHQASPQEQIEVAERVLDAQGWGAWPACSRKLGLR